MHPGALLRLAQRRAWGQHGRRRLQVFLYFGGWWGALFWVLSILVSVYKGLNLPFPPGRFAAEFTFQWLWLLVEPPRIFLASKGNKTEQAGPLLLSLLLDVPLAAFYAYYIHFQTFVLKAEVLLNAISLAFLGLQALFGGLAAARFISAARIN